MAFHFSLNGVLVVCAGGWPRPLGLEGIEAIMFRTIGDRPSLWESLLPPEVLRLPVELARVDALLDDPAFFAPFALRLRKSSRVWNASEKHNNSVTSMPASSAKSCPTYTNASSPPIGFSSHVASSNGPTNSS